MTEPISRKEKRALPVLLIKPNTISAKDIRRAERLGFICIVECENPESVRYCDPPLGLPIDAQARAAMKLFRYVLSSGGQSFYRAELTKLFCDAILQEPPEQIKKVSKP